MYWVVPPTAVCKTVGIISREVASWSVTITTHQIKSRSSRGPGYRPFTANTPVRIRYGTPYTNTLDMQIACRDIRNVSVFLYGRLAQLVERRLYTANVGGSRPSPPTKYASETWKSERSYTPFSARLAFLSRFDSYRWYQY